MMYFIWYLCYLFRDNIKKNSLLFSNIVDSIVDYNFVETFRHGSILFKHFKMTGYGYANKPEFNCTNPVCTYWISVSESRKLWNSSSESSNVKGIKLFQCTRLVEDEIPSCRWTGPLAWCPNTLHNQHDMLSEAWRYQYCVLWKWLQA